MQQGIRVPMLDWSPDLFAQANVNTTAPLMGNGKPKTDARLCDCGCGQRHNYAVSALDGEAGHRRVMWFRTMQCKNRKMGVGHAT